MSLPKIILENKTDDIKFKKQIYAYKDLVKLIHEYRYTQGGIEICSDCLNSLKSRLMHTNNWNIRMGIFNQLRLIRLHAIDLLDGVYIHDNGDNVFSDLTRIFCYDMVSNHCFKELPKYSQVIKPCTYLTYLMVFDDIKDNGSKTNHYWKNILNNSKAFGIGYFIKHENKDLKNFLSTFHNDYADALK